MKSLNRGKFPYKDKKKKLSDKEEKRRLLKKKDKELKMMCECNHLDSRKNKPHLTELENGDVLKCKICGGEFFGTEKYLDAESIKMAQKIVYTIFSLVRNKFPIDDKIDNDITRTLHMVLRMDELYNKMKSHGNGKSDKKNKKNKEKKKKTKGYFRMQY